MLKLASFPTSKKARDSFAATLAEILASDRDLLVLLSGGSVIPLYNEAIENFPISSLAHVVFTLVDERYGEDGHNDSNYEQIRRTGFFDKVLKMGAKVIAVSMKQPLHLIPKTYNMLLSPAARNRTVVGVFGVGSDGHTAGILPMQEEKMFESTFMNTQELLVSYNLDLGLKEKEFNPYRKRFTITPYFIRNYVEMALVYAVGEAKIKPLKAMFEKGPVSEVPARLLVEKAGYVITDQAIKI
jgi:6-phosphogluconolactonase/glucosamine-6-phosphate isomerase/deaminase